MMHETSDGGAPRDTGGAGLVEEFRASGRWLFRWRSYVPLVLLAFLLASTILDPSVAGGPRWTAFWIVMGLVLGILGLVIRAWTVGYVPSGTSGRGTKRMRAETLNQADAYSLVRHPLYLGNLFMWLGAAAFVGRPTVILLTGLAFWVYYERIMFAEEAFLQQGFGEQFAEWAARTPAIFPALQGTWRRSDLPFSLRYCFGRDYQALYGFVATTFVIQSARLWVEDGGFRFHAAWSGYFAAGTVVYFLLHALKRHTRLLEAPDR